MHERQPLRRRDHRDRGFEQGRWARRASAPSSVTKRDAAGFSPREPGDEEARHARLRLGQPRFRGLRASRSNHMLGPENQGFATFMKTLEGGRISIGALGLGIAQGAYDCALKYAREREAFGKHAGRPAGRRSSSWPTWRPRSPRRATWSTTPRASRTPAKPFGKAAASMAKLYSSEVAMRVQLRRHSDLRRLRLQPRVPGRAHVARREAVHDRRGHQRDPAPDHRAQRSFA